MPISCLVGRHSYVELDDHPDMYGDHQRCALVRIAR
jgi:hypothetical protein